MQLTGCTQVRFLLKHADLLTASIRENIPMETLKVEVQSFSHVILNDNALEDNSNFAVAFKELKQGMRGFFKDRVYVQPFHKLGEGSTKEQEDVVSLIVQLEIETSRITPN